MRARLGDQPLDEHQLEEGAPALVAEGGVLVGPLPPFGHRGPASCPHAVEPWHHADASKGLLLPLEFGDERGHNPLQAGGHLTGEFDEPHQLDDGPDLLVGEQGEVSRVEPIPRARRSPRERVDGSSELISTSSFTSSFSASCAFNSVISFTSAS